MGKLIQELDLLDVLKFIGRKNRIYQAKTLQEYEEILGKDSEAYQKIRKITLDNLNDYTREILREIFGDIEYLIK